MVDENDSGDDIELALDEPKGSKRKLLALILAGLLLAGGGTTGALFFMGILPPGAKAAVAEDPEEVEGEETEEADSEAPKEAFYVALDPPFTVNFRGTGGARYLQLTAQAMTREEEVEPQLKKHMPVIRNDLMLLFSSKSSKDLASREGKETLQREALAAVRKILERETGEPGVEAVYFTSFVMQ